jgi:nucleoside-diphosphate-sugar epimerase
MTAGHGPVLVTGATGFLGAHVASAFAAKGWTVVAAHRAGADLRRLAGLTGLATVVCRLDDRASLEAALERTRAEAVVHCAAYGVDYSERDLDRAVAVNVNGTADLVAAAARAGVRRFLHVGTSYEYGSAASPVREDTPLEPRSVYGATKAAGAVLARQIARAAKLPLAVARPFAMYGPTERSTKLVPSLIAACLAGKRMALTKGEQRRDYTYVGDIADAIRRLVELADFPDGEAVNLSSGEPMTLRALAEEIRRAVGGSDVFGWGDLPYRDDEIMALWADATKAERLIGKVSKTPLGEGVLATRRALTEGAMAGS